MNDFNNDDDSLNYNNKISKKKKDRLTKAEKNKKRDKNIKLFEKSKIKSLTDIIKEIDDAPTIMKNLEAEEKLRELNKQISMTKKAARKSSTAVVGAYTAESGMNYLEAGSVPLTDELKGSLRQVLPKGTPINDQVEKMRSDGLLMLMNRRKRRAQEKPHGAEKIKWIAKYKYV